MRTASPPQGYRFCGHAPAVWPSTRRGGCLVRDHGGCDQASKQAHRDKDGLGRPTTDRASRAGRSTRDPRLFDPNAVDRDLARPHAGRGGPVGRALMAAGFSIIEVPLNSPQTLDSIASLSADLAGDCLIGADTVTTPKQVSTHRRHGRARQSPPWASPHRAHRRGWLPWRLNVPRRGRILGRPEPRFQILYAQMISNPRHASPPRLMAHQPTRFPTTQESQPESIARNPYQPT